MNKIFYILMVAISYALVAKVGFLTTSFTSHIAPIFPAAGIALASTLLLGRPALFGVWLGSFAINFTFLFDGTAPLFHAVLGQLLESSSIGIGAMAGAAAGALLVRRFCNGQYPLNSGRNVLVLVTVGALGCCMISPTVGVLTLSLRGIIPWGGCGQSWLTWWIGDAVGVILAAPLILAWNHSRPFPKTSNSAWKLAFESSILGGISLLFCFFVFYKNVPIQFGLIPLLFWATVRYGDRGAATVAGAITVLATIATSHGNGPFVRDSVNESLLLLQSFIGVIIIPSLFLAGVMAERKRSEETLHISDAYNKLLFASHRTPLIVMDAHTFKYVDCNEAAVRIYGYDSREEVLGKMPLDMSAPRQEDGTPSEQLAQEYIRTCREKGEVAFEWLHQRPDGSRWYADVHLMFFHSQGHDLIQFSLHDITSRLEAEKALRISEEKYRHIVENAPIGIFQSEREGKFDYANPETLRQFECNSIEEFLKKYGLISQRWAYPEKRDEFKELLIKNKKVYAYELETRLVNGKNKFFSLTAFFDDRTSLINGFSLDITERKRAEEALRESEAQYRLIVENAPMGIFRRALEGKLLYSNPGMIRQLECKTEKECMENYGLISQRWAHPEKNDEYKALLLENRRVYGYENEMRLVSGETKWFALYGFLDDSGQFINGFSIDITDRKRAEDLLRESERKARAIFDLSFGFIGLLTPEGTLVEVNRSALEFAGVQLSDVLGKPFWETPWWTHSTNMRERIRAAVFTAASGELVRFEATHPAADGTLRNIDVSVKPVKDGAGRVVFLIPEGRDISEVKQKTDALRENERRLSRLMENLFGMVYRCKNDRDWTMEFVSAGCSELTGYRPEDILHNNKVSYNDLIHPEDQQRIWDEIQAALSRKDHYILEYRICTAGGKEKWVWEQGSGVFSQDGEVLALEGFISDITDRKQAEEERARLAAAIEQADETVVITDRDGTIQYVNPAFERITGYAKTEAIGLNPRVLKSGKHNDAFYKELWNTVSGGETWKGHFINKKKNGGLYEEEATITPVKSDDDTIVNFVAVKRDVTQELRLEDQIRQAQKMEAIGTLAGGIAHDFNNILGGIMGYTELAMGEPTGSTKTAGYLSEALKSADRARTLVKQILTFSRRTKQESKPLQPDLIIKEACKLLRASLPSTIVLRQQLYGSGTLIMGDPTHIYQIVMNLCTNAHHAMRESGGVLDVGLQPVDLAPEDLPQYPGLQQEGAYLKLSVSDTGCGISQAHLDRIFDPYFTTKEKGEGTGLGLSVVDGIVKGLGGAIKVTSEEGRGTTFDVLFPRLIAKIAASPEEGAAQPLPRGKETILFVDDEETLRFTGAQMLHQLGYRVVLAANAAEALEIFLDKRDSLDLVITDKTMPKMTGFELARAIKNLRPDIPIVLCTGYSEKEDMAVGEAIGISQFVMKPLRKKALAETVRQVLDRGNAANG